MWARLGCRYIYGLAVGVGLILVAKVAAAGICFYLGKVLLDFACTPRSTACQCHLCFVCSCERLLQFMFADWVNSMLKKNATFKTLKKNTGSSGFMLVLGLRLSPVPSYLCSYCASASTPCSVPPSTVCGVEPAPSAAGVCGCLCVAVQYARFVPDAQHGQAYTHGVGRAGHECAIQRLHESHCCVYCTHGRQQREPCLAAHADLRSVHAHLAIETCLCLYLEAPSEQPLSAGGGERVMGGASGGGGRHQGVNACLEEEAGIRA